VSFDWSQFLLVAEDLSSQSRGRASHEARLRSALSRAYYAAFCQARNYLRDRHGHTIPPAARAHGYASAAFLTSSDRRWTEIGARLDSMRRRRNLADYADIVNNLIQVARSELRSARRVHSLLRTL